MDNNGDIIGIDLSLRSTGIIRMSQDKELLDFEIVRSVTLKEERLLLHNTKKIMKFIKRDKTYCVALEGLSFGGKSAMKDVIDGNYWMVRCAIRKFNKKIFIGSIPVLTWRNDILSKLERKNAKGVRDGLKIAVVDKLPKDIKGDFEYYLKNNNLPKKSVYDLADAYGVVCYRHKLLMGG